MSAHPDARKMTLAEYLVFEEASVEKHEYVNGMVHAMSGGTPEHSGLNPIVIVEVLSKTSEAYDRGAKANHYRQLASLREYVLVSQDEPRIEVQRLNAQGLWELRFFGKGDEVELASVGARFSLDAVYRDPLTATPAQ